MFLILKVNDVTLVKKRGVHDPDMFFVKENFTCSCESGERCWEQMYSGLLCQHSVLVAVNRIKHARDSEVERLVCERVVQFCNPNWQRKTFQTIPKIHVSNPPKLNMIVKDDVVDDQRLEFISRFRDVIDYLDPGIVDGYLRAMETKTLQPVPLHERATFSAPEDETISSSDSDVVQYVNPPKRRKKKLRFKSV